MFKEILIVDDDPGVTRLLEKILSEKGYAISFTNEASVGLQIAMNKNPDLIILDVMMPIINGFNFCHLLKTHDEKKHIPIIFLTSRDELDDIKIGLNAGADAYLTKPVNPEELLKTIHVVEKMASKT